MKIGVISDTHGDLEAWQKSYKYFKGAKYILHSGDVLSHGVFNPIVKTYNAKELATAINDSKAPLIFARGNCDADVDQIALKYPISSQLSDVVLDGLSILIHHGDKLSNEELVEQYKPTLIISGHTHIYDLKKQGNTVFLNPGSPSLPKNPQKIPTIAVIKDKTISIIDIDSGDVLEQKEI